MTTDSTMSDHSAESRVEGINQRVAELRRRTQRLGDQAHEASDHGEDVEQLAATLTEVEQELEGLRVAMATRAVIEQAKGMLMLREGCDADAAFAMLVDLSQRGHRKLVDVARTIVATWSAGEHAGT